MDAIDCFALYGTVNWEMDDVQKFVSSMHCIFGQLNVPATHYVCYETPRQKNGHRIGSTRNVQKKISSLYTNDLRLKALEFYSLPKGYDFPYLDYRAYFARCEDFIVLAYHTDMCNVIAEDTVISELRNHISPIWGEHFQAAKGDRVIHCFGKFKNNPYGKNLKDDFYDLSVHVIKQFKL